MAMNLELKKFDMSQISDDKVVVLIGKRDTGKSFLCRDILYHHRDIPVGQVISGTEGANQFYQKIIPKLFIHGEFTPEVVQNMLKRQKLMIDKINGGDRSTDPRAFLILDDCLYDNTWAKDKNMRSVFMNGRHYKLLFLLTMQYALGIPPNLRTNIDYVFILRENYVSNRKRLYEHYAGMFPTFEMFCQVMDQCTENYECLVINNNAKSNKLSDQVFWYKAEPRPDFKIGADSYWLYSKQNFSKENVEKEENYGGAKKTPVQVNKVLY
tara:strand:- start:376 stop:1179 length:804 start_codon:yes stop_codon:yes gene_type:complete